jgi:sugar O-acyltransferase (sialic acid O-acetyltransferase NeuD family)
MKSYIIFGVSAFISDIFDIIHTNGGKVYKIYLNMPEVVRSRAIGLKERISLLGYEIKVYDSLDPFKPEKDCCYALGTTSPHKYRLIEELKSKFSLSFSTLIHPKVHFGSNVRIGEGVTVNVQTTVGPNVFLSRFCALNRCTSIGHETRIGPYSLIGPGVAIAGSVTIGEKCTLGIGATVIDRLRIGDWAVVGAGSLVTKDIPEGTVVYGVPAKAIRKNEEQDFTSYQANRFVNKTL